MPIPENLMYRCNSCQSLCKTIVEKENKEVVFFCKRCGLEYAYTDVEFEEWKQKHKWNKIC